MVTFKRWSTQILPKLLNKDFDIKVANNLGLNPCIGIFAWFALMANGQPWLLSTCKLNETKWSWTPEECDLRHDCGNSWKCQTRICNCIDIFLCLIKDKATARSTNIPTKGWLLLRCRQSSPHHAFCIGEPQWRLVRFRWCWLVWIELFYIW